MLSDAELVRLAEAIREHRFITVRYNRGLSMLAPYGTFTRRDELYLTAVTMARDGVQPGKLKLGTFKVAGLSELQETPVPFSAPGLYAQVQRQMPQERRV